MSGKLRITEDQARLLFGQRPAAATAPKKARKQKQRDALPENQVEQQLLDYLGAKGWELHRQHSGTMVGLAPLMGCIRSGRPVTMAMLGKSMVRLGEKGRCDWIAVRPAPATVLVPLVSHQHLYVQRVEIEVKAPGESPSPEQFEYIRRRNLLGYLAVWVDRILAGDKGESEALEVWYRRMIGQH